MPQTRSRGQDKPVAEPPVATSQPAKRKRGPKKNTTAEELAVAEEVERTVNKRLADLEVARSCDNDLPTPRPLSESRRSSTLSHTNSRADISALVAQQRRASKELACRSAAGDSATGESAASGTTKPSGLCSDDNDGYTDEEDHQIPIRKLRKVVIPDPVTPVAAQVRRPTAVQKQDAERAKQAAKEAERLAKEEAKVKKTAERKAKAQAKEDERERKAEEKREKAREKAREKEAKDLEKKVKRAKTKLPAADSQVANTTTTDGLPSALAGTKANAAGKVDNTGEQDERRDKEKQATGVATGSKKKEKGKGKSEHGRDVYEEHQILFRLGKYSSEPSSLQYSGLNPGWVRSQPPYSEPLAKRPLNPPPKSLKPFSAAATTRPSDLDNEVLVDDNSPPHLRPAKNYPYNFQTPSKQQPNWNAPETPETPNALDCSDSPMPADANIPMIRVDSPSVEVKDRYDEFSDEEAAAVAERDFALSSPMKPNRSSDDDLIVEEPPPKAPAARGKKRWQMSDLPHGMNEHEAWRKMLIPTVYWYLGNQRDVWIYGDDNLASDLGKIISAVYPSTLRPRVTVSGPIFRITAARLSDWIYKIGTAGLTAVNAYLAENFQTDDQRQEHAEWILQDLRFLWRDNKGQKLKGLWLNEVFLRTFASHYNQIGGARRVDAFGNPKLLRPIGAAGLCAASVERAYKLWATKTITTDTLHDALPGSFVKPTKAIRKEVGSNGKLLATQFCHATCGRYQIHYADSAAKIKDAQWDVIIGAARHFAKASKKAVKSAATILEDEANGASSSARANLVESDSD